MNVPPHLKEFGSFNTRDIRKFLKSQDIDWDGIYNKMNNRTPYFSETYSFPIVEEYEPWDWGVYKEFFPLLKDIITTCQYTFGPGRIYKCNFGMVPSQSRIYPHKDTGLSFAFSHRMHLPIITNNNVYFQIGGNFYNLKEGKLYEINNQKVHGVRNNNHRKFNRIHLIMDWMGEEYYKFL